MSELSYVRKSSVRRSSHFHGDGLLMIVIGTLVLIALVVGFSTAPPMSHALMHLRLALGR